MARDENFDRGQAVKESNVKRAKSHKYDDVSWHGGGDFPKELPPDAARTHIGMFLGWAILRNLESDLLKEQFRSQLTEFRAGRRKGSDLVRLCCDDKFTSDDLSDKGNKFAKYYYEGKYFDDYVDLSSNENETIYHEPDSQEKFKIISDVLDERFSEWEKNHG